MKIAILLLSGGVVYRGAERSMLMLAEDLVKLGHEVTVFQTGEAPNAASYNVIKISLPVMPTSRKPTGFFGKVLERLYLNSRGLLTLIFSSKLSTHIPNYDVIIPTDGFWQVLITKLNKKKSAKIITVGLAGIGWTDRDTLKLRPDVFVALNSKAAAWAKRVNPRVHIETIPLQVDVEEFAHTKPASIELKKPIIMTVAALTKYKRVDAVIRAAAQIENASLLIAGQGEERENLTKLAESLLPGRYQIVSLPFDKLPGLYKAADVFTLASEPVEAFGQVLVEAMAAGLPIVTTDDSIRREIVGSKGIFTDPMNRDQYAEALKIAIQHQRLEYPLEPYNRRQVAKRYHHILTELVE